MSISKKPAPKTSNRPLTRKQKAFVEYLVNHPKESATKAALATYNTVDYHTAGDIAHQNLKKPEIVTELSKYNNMVENTLINTIKDFGSSDKVNERALATDTAKYVHDKIHGRATQKTEVVSTGITLNIDLNSALTEVE